MINSTQHAFDKLKKDLSTKEALVESKEKEIAFLKSQIQDLLKSPKIQQKSGQEGSQRRKWINDMVFMIDTARHELNKLKAIVKKTTSPVERKFSPLRSSQIPILSEDQFIVEFNQ